MKKLFAALLSLALLITTVGCIGEEEKPTEKETLPEEIKTTETAETEQADPHSVEKLRGQMKEGNYFYAVAYLGYLSHENGSVQNFIDQLGDGVWQKLPFLKQIPEGNIIAKETQGEVYCLIPASPQASVQVFSDSSEEKAVFTGSSAEPYLLVCNSRYSSDCYVTITDSLGGEDFTMWWYPKLDQYLYVEPSRYVEGTSGLMDISPYNQMLLSYYDDMKKNDNWEIPLKTDLENTAWYWDGYNSDGSYYEYRVSFGTETANVRWNAGYGETTEYENANWSYENGEICVLTIDFGDFAGVRKYNLLVDENEGRMYIAADATGKGLTWDSEPQYRFLLLEEAKG